MGFEMDKRQLIVTGVLGKKASVVTPWYLLGGISASNLIYAYRAKGAASYAASLLDLGGTYNITDKSDPAWDTNYGWSQTATTQYLLPSYAGWNQDTTIIARVITLGSAGRCLWGETASTGGVYLGIGTPVSYPMAGWNTSNWQGYAPGAADPFTGIVALIGNKLYQNATLKLTITDATWNMNGQKAALLNRWRATSLAAVGFTGGYLAAIVVYNTRISSDQYTAVCAAMNGL